LIKIDYSKCLKCGKCLMVCKRGPLRAPEKDGEAPLVIEDENAACFLCAHCASVCPAGAITVEGLKDVEFGALPSAAPHYEDYIAFIRSRRSTRNYKNIPVPGELIARVIDSARYAPTAKNSCGVCVTAVTGNSVSKLAGLTFEFYKGLMEIVKSPVKKYFFMLAAGISTFRAIKKNMPAFEYGYKMWLDGTDLLFYDAPALLIVHADKTLPMPKDDCDYALYEMTLAAETLGLATCVNGFFLRAAENSKELRRFIKLPAGHEPYGAITLGFPALKFKKTPARKPVNVTYIS